VCVCVIALRPSDSPSPCDIADSASDSVSSARGKPIFCHLFKKLPAFCGDRMFVAVFTAARYWILSSVLHASGRSSHTVFFLRFVLILSSPTNLGLPSGLFLLGFPTHILYAFAFSAVFLICRTDLLLLLLLLSSVSPLCRVSTLKFLRQTMSLRNTVL
jgi:hypothetical protein